MSSLMDVVSFSMRISPCIGHQKSLNGKKRMQNTWYGLHTHQFSTQLIICGIFWSNVCSPPPSSDHHMRMSLSVSVVWHWFYKSLELYWQDWTLFFQSFLLVWNLVTEKAVAYDSHNFHIQSIQWLLLRYGWAPWHPERNCSYQDRNHLTTALYWFAGTSHANKIPLTA